MIGIGVGIDYALFIVTRYRQGIFEGRDPRDAVVMSHMTAGRSVLFAGSTVVISLFGLFLIGQAYMIGLATACIAAVLMVLLAALTLLPAMLGLRRRRHRQAAPAGAAAKRRAAARERVLAPLEPLRAAAGLGDRHRRRRSSWSRWRCPLFSMRLAFTDAGNDPTSLTTRQAYDLLAQGFGPGFNGPLVVAADMQGPADVGHRRPAPGHRSRRTTTASPS